MMMSLLTYSILKLSIFLIPTYSYLCLYYLTHSCLCLYCLTYFCPFLLTRANDEEIRMRKMGGALLLSLFPLATSLPTQPANCEKHYHYYCKSWKQGRLGTATGSLHQRVKRVALSSVPHVCGIFDFHSAQRHSVTNIAINRFNIINATQGNSQNAPDACQIPQMT